MKGCPQIDDCCDVSVLVPVYNVQDYLNQCLTSIITQTLKSIEIICINDGSTDSSLAIIQRFAAADARLRVIDVANGGYGKALNLGLAQAKGRYLSVIESDDFVQQDMLETLFNAAEKNEAQVAKGNFWLTWTELESGGIAREEFFTAVPEDLADRVVAPWREWRVIQPQPAIWSALYRRDFLIEHAIDFLESPGASFQDTSFNYEVWTAAERVALVGQALVHYRQNNASSSINATSKVMAVANEFKRYFAWLDAWEAHDFTTRKARAAHLRQIMQGVVYKTYRWNLRRISADLRPEFLDYMYSYFGQAQSRALLHREYFEADDFNELQLLLRDPAKFLEINNMLLAPGKRLGKLRYYLCKEGLRPTIQRALGRL